MGQLPGPDLWLANFVYLESIHNLLGMEANGIYRRNDNQATPAPPPQPTRRFIYGREVRVSLSLIFKVRTLEYQSD